MGLNRELLKAARAALRTTKLAFVPPGGGAPPADPMAAAGGAPPMDPAMAAAGGGTPPMDPAMAAAGGAPPMDPAMAAAGGAPPMDPAMAAAGGGAPPPDPAAMGMPPGGDPMAGGGAPPPADPAAAGGGGDIRSIIRDEIQQAMGGGAGGAGAKPKGKGKVDPEQLQQYMQRNQKLMTHLYSSIGIPLPYDILDDPKPEGEEGGDAKGGGGSSSGSGGGSSGTDKKAENPTGIKPILPIQPMGGAKTASVAEKAQAARLILQKLGQ